MGSPDFLSSCPRKTILFGDVPTWKVSKWLQLLPAGVGRDWEMTESSKREVSVCLPVWLEQTAS